MDAREACGEWEREKPCSAVKVYGCVPLRFVDGGGDEGREQLVVDLKEAVGAEAVMVSSDGARCLRRLVCVQGWGERCSLVARDGLKLFYVGRKPPVSHAFAQGVERLLQAG